MKHLISAVIIAVIALFLLFVVSFVPRLVHVAKVSVQVVDEEGRPVEGADVGITFNLKSTTREATKGGTDANGSFTATGSSRDGVIGVVAAKEHYYDSELGHRFLIRRWGLWQPWDKKIQVRLRPVANPVPMYVRNSSFKFPVIGKRIGFDMTKSDWVKPYGEGTRPDIFFLINRNYRDNDHFEATLSITFPDPNDGIQLVLDRWGGAYGSGSEYKLPRVAPEGGYRSTLMKTASSGSHGYKDDRSNDNNYIFRVRTERANGQVRRAMYGKILGDIQFAPLAGDNGAIVMHYYLNPDHSRNLEFDPKRNLFTSLPDREGVARP